MNIRSILLFSMLIPISFSLNILVYILVIGRSHLDFGSSLTSHLADRGHNVDVVIARLNPLEKGNGSSKARRIIEFGFEDGKSPWLAVDHLKNPFEKVEKSFFSENMMTIFDRSVNALCERALENDRILDFLRAETYDIALTTSYEYCSLAMFHAVGLDNVAGFSPTSITQSQTYSAGLPSPPSYVVDVLEAHPKTITLSFWDRFWNVLRFVRKDVYGNPKYIRSTDATIRRHFNSSFPSVEELAKKYTVMFVNANELIEKPRPISHKIKYIGGINMKKPKPLPEQFDQLLSTAKKGNVVFSFGTQVPSGNIPLSIRKQFISAFCHFPEYNFIWKYNNACEERELFVNASNVYTVDWMPQRDILADPRTVAFISHMGLNSLLESAYSGVPMVALPLFADQVWNANMALEKGIAVVIEKSEVSEEALIRALGQVLGNERMAAKSRKLAVMLEKKPENVKEQFIKWTEYAAEFKNLDSHFNLGSVEMGYLEAYCLDVIALQLTIMFTVLIVFYTIVKRLYGIVLAQVKLVKKVKNQ